MSAFSSELTVGGCKVLVEQSGPHLHIYLGNSDDRKLTVTCHEYEDEQVLALSAVLRHAVELRRQSQRVWRGEQR